jgi:hypothetical protein
MGKKKKEKLAKKVKAEKAKKKEEKKKSKKTEKKKDKEKKTKKKLKKIKSKSVQPKKENIEIVVEVTKKSADVIEKSKHLNVKIATDKIRALLCEKSLESFVRGDLRVTIKKASAIRKRQLIKIGSSN